MADAIRLQRGLLTVEVGAEDAERLKRSGWEPVAPVRETEAEAEMPKRPTRQRKAAAAK